MSSKELVAGAYYDILVTGLGTGTAVCSVHGQFYISKPASNKQETK